MTPKDFLKEKKINDNDFMDSGVCELIESLLDEYVDRFYIDLEKKFLLENKISNILIDNSLLAIQEKWDKEKIYIRAIYDTKRIINLINNNIKYLKL